MALELHMSREKFFEAWREECREYSKLLEETSPKNAVAIQRQLRGPLLLDLLRGGALFVDGKSPRDFLGSDHTRALFPEKVVIR